MTVCCRICRCLCANEAGLRVHAARRHAAPPPPRTRWCDRCGRYVARTTQGLNAHNAEVHGERSTHPKSIANRGAGTLAHIEPDGTPVALLEAVIRQAMIDAATYEEARRWLRELRTWIRR